MPYNAQLLHDIANPKGLTYIQSPQEKQTNALQLQALTQQNQIRETGIQDAATGKARAEEEWTRVKGIFDKNAGDPDAAIAEVLSQPWRDSEIQKTYTAAAAARRTQKAEGIADQTRVRAEAIDTAKLLEGTEGPTLETGMAPVQQAPIPQQLDGSEMSAPAAVAPEGSRSIALPLPPVEIPGVSGPGVTVRPQSRQQKEQATVNEEQRKLANDVTLARAREEAQRDFAVPTKVNPANLQSKEIIGTDGKPSFANFNPDNGQYLDPKTGAVIPNARPYERPQDPAIAELRAVQTRLAEMQVAGMGLTPNQRANEINTLRSQWTKAVAPIMDRRGAIAKVDVGLKQLEAGNFRDSTQILITAFNKLLDEISVVREGEYDRSTEGQALKDRIVGSIVQLQRGGSALTKENLQQLGAAAKDMAKTVGDVHEAELRNLREGIEKTLDDFKIPQDRVFGQSQIGKPKTAAPAAPAAKVMTDDQVNKEMRANPKYTRQEIIAALEAQGFQKAK